MIQEDKRQKDIIWWEMFQSLVIRLLYALFGLPFIIWVVSKLNSATLGDPFGAGFWVKIFCGFLAMIIFLLLPIFIQKKLSRLMTPEQKEELLKRIKPFPLETPVYLFLGSIILFPYSLVYPWFGAVVFIVYIIIGELYLKKRAPTL